MTSRSASPTAAPTSSCHTESTGVYFVDIPPGAVPGVRCPVTLAQSWFTDASMKINGWVCDATGYHVSFVTSDGNDAGFWFQVLQIQDDQG